MRINSQNIEQWIFDYHEEMLSETEKTELLDFLHANPEYNAEFGLWAQTHALKNEEIYVPADLLEGIIQPIATPFYYNKFVLGAVTGIALSAVVTGYFFLSNKTTKPITIETVIENEILKEERKIKTTKPNITQETRPKSQASNKKVLLDPSSEQVISSSSSSDSTVHLREEHKKHEPITNMVEKTLPDTISKPLEISEKETLNKEIEKTTEVRKKKRSLLPFSVKPQSKFKPANPDF